MSYPTIPQLAVPRGTWGTVEFAVRSSGAIPAEKFLVDLGPDAAIFLALFNEVSAHGRTNNSNRFSHEAGEVWAFKAEIKNRQIRFPCFQIGNRWILAYGFFKPGAQKGRGRWKPEDLQKANNIRREHLEVERIQKEAAQRQRNMRQR